MPRPEFNNLVVHWPMDEDDGFVLFDAVGNNHANLSGKTTRVDGKLGGAIEFDGSTAFAWSNPNFAEVGLSGKQPLLNLLVLDSPSATQTNPGLYGYGERSNYDNRIGFGEFTALQTINFCH